MVGAFYRLHSIRSIVQPNITCKAVNATDQIGCLVQASPCSIGFAGNSAVIPGTVALNANGSPPADACVQNGTYPLRGKLYLNTIDGFGAITPDQYRLARCFVNNAPGLVAANGFVPLGQPPCCVDYNEAQSGCFGVSAPNQNACADNISPIPSALCPF